MVQFLDPKNVEILQFLDPEIEKNYKEVTDKLSLLFWVGGLADPHNSAQLSDYF